MGHYPFTLFNGITLLVLILALAIAWMRFRRPGVSIWPAICYVLIAAYTWGFAGSLNPYWVAGGAACAVAIRAGLQPARLRFVELIPLAYIVYRSIALLLMW